MSQHISLRCRALPCHETFPFQRNPRPRPRPTSIATPLNTKPKLYSTWQGLECEHGLTILGRQLRHIIEGQVPVAAGISEEGRGDVGAEVLTEAEWLDLTQVSERCIVFIFFYMRTTGIFYHNKFVETQL